MNLWRQTRGKGLLAVMGGARCRWLRGWAGGAQGAAWDPANKFIATLSCDRTCRCDLATLIPHHDLIGCTDELWVTVVDRDASVQHYSHQEACNRGSSPVWWDAAGAPTRGKSGVGRVHGLKPPVAGRKARREQGSALTAAAIAKDFVCHHVLARGPAAVAPAAGDVLPQSQPQNFQISRPFSR